MDAVSVIIPTYNRSLLLQRAIDSALSATDRIDEIIVVDDGSTDDTAEVVRSFGPRVQYIKRQRCGAGAARNAGIAAASHDLITFVDSDDEWLSSRLVLQRPLMASDRDLVFSFSDFGQLYPDDSRESNFLVNWHKDTRSWNEILGQGRRYSEILPLPSDHPDTLVHVGSLYRHELSANYVNVNTLMVRQSLAGGTFNFAEDLPTYEDWDCFARISRVGTCAFIDCDTALQRRHDGLRLTQASSLTQVEARIKIIERNWAVDQEFMALHSRAVNMLIASLQKARVRQLIRGGRLEEASALIPKLENAYIERLALRLPRSVFRALASAYTTWVNRM
jgi:glycosyltransferase involved in cell wall biosynthesis